MDTFFNYMNIFKIILKWKFHLLLLVGASVILSGIFSSKLFVKPLYRSYAVLYPSNIFPYSDESETEQMLQLLNSSSIRDSVIKKFDLGKHWGLENEKEYYTSTLFYLYGKRNSIKKTEFESVVGEVMDIDPQTACDMVNAILKYYDVSVHALQNKKFHEVVLNYKQVLAKKKASLDSLQGAIDELTSSKGLPPVNIPDPALIRTFAEKMKDQQTKEKKKKNDPVELKLGQRMRVNPGTKDAQLVLLTSLAMSEAEAYSELNLKYDEALLNDNRNYTYSNIVTTPFVADKKSFPKTWLIISLSALATLFLSLVIISFIENKDRSTKGNISSIV